MIFHCDSGVFQNTLILFYFMIAALLVKVRTQLVRAWLFLHHKLDVCQWMRSLNLLLQASRFMIGVFLMHQDPKCVCVLTKLMLNYMQLESWQILELSSFG